MMMVAEPVSEACSQLLGGLVGVGGVVLGEVADGAAANQAAEDGNVDAHVAHDDIGQEQQRRLQPEQQRSIGAGTQGASAGDFWSASLLGAGPGRSRSGSTDDAGDSDQPEAAAYRLKP